MAASLPLDLPCSSSAFHESPPRNLPCSSEATLSDGLTHIYLLTEQDLMDVMARSQAGVALDETLLELWTTATRVNLEELDDDTDLFEVIAAATEIDPAAFHALIFTYSEDE
jgi:hypothetical protein